MHISSKSAELNGKYIEPVDLGEEKLRNATN